MQYVIPNNMYFISNSLHITCSTNTIVSKNFRNSAEFNFVFFCVSKIYCKSILMRQVVHVVKWPQYKFMPKKKGYIVLLIRHTWSLVVVINYGAEVGVGRIVVHVKTHASVSTRRNFVAWGGTCHLAVRPGKPVSSDWFCFDLVGYRLSIYYTKTDSYPYNPYLLCSVWTLRSEGWVNPKLCVFFHIPRINK
jgi:hypothetical protein